MTYDSAYFCAMDVPLGAPLEFCLNSVFIHFILGVFSSAQIAWI